MLRALRSRLACVALAVTGAAACATEAVGDDGLASARDDALIEGRLALAGQFPATVYIQGLCTATKIAPKRFLTAAHCVLDPATVSLRYPPGAPIALAHDPSKGYASVVVSAVHVHPSWLKACDESYCAAAAVTARLDAADVAVIDLATDLEDVPVAPIDSTPLAGGDHVTVTGFGCTVGVYAPEPLGRGALRYGETSLIDADRAVHDGSPVRASDVSQVAAIYALTQGPGRAPTLAGLCPGDSGGALFRRRAGGSYAVVGVNSNYTLGPETGDAVGLPVTNWHTRLDEKSRHGVGRWLRSLGVPTL